MRILMLNETAAPQGGEMNHYVIDVATRLRAMGDTVALVHGRHPKSEFRGTGYIFDHLRAFNGAIEEARIRLEAIVDDFKPDLIQIHGAANERLHPWLTARAPTVRWIHNHDFYCSGDKMTHAWPRNPCKRAHGKACLALHATVGCGSANPIRNWLRYQQVSTKLASLRTLPGLQVSSRMMADNLVRNGIDPARVVQIPLYAPTATGQKKLSLSPRRFVLHPGGLVPHKGVWLLVRQIARLPDDVDLVFAGGGGPLERPLNEYAARHGLSRRIRVMGSVSPEQWCALFTQAELVVIPSLWNEPLGLAGIYAMAHGKPTVAFHGTGMDDWLINGETGISIPFGARADFVEAVIGLLNTPERLCDLGAQAYQRWKAEFRPEVHLQTLRAYYAEVVARGTGA